MASQPSLTERDLETDLGKLLRAGVSIAAAVVLAGGIWFLAKYSGEPPHYSRFAYDPASSRKIPAVLRAVFTGQSRALIQLGLMLLIATPVARVLFSLILFARIRDFKYCVITTIVLGILLWSLLG